ncbi:hypothetical protein [Thermoanaerobacterium sp. R66]|uniref:hypothetical protein n=1 Tax=Thermoanaerobacterium sp. R66 TaxID=2742479 RepID=UPI0023808DC1|nr:hypothetical protein [Thermoanaerobacterium sp. R66]MDE4541342.1 hypothetical protein [Thermoanaerobacterium sp. R66]
MIKIKAIIFCWDFIFSLIISLFLLFILKGNLNGTFLKDIYNTGVTVLSILFTIFFAALAIIISSWNDDFIKLLEEDNDFINLLHNFRYSLKVTFITLIITIFLYTYTNYNIIKNNNYVQIKYIPIIFSFVFFYSLFTIFNSALDSIKFVENMVRYIKNKFIS